MSVRIGELQEMRNEVLKVEWRIDNFLSYESTDDSYKSPNFRFSNSSWYLEIHFDSVEGEGDFSDSVSLYLRKTESCENEVVICELGVKQEDRTVEPLTANFVWKFNDDDDAYGTSEICRSSKLLRGMRNLLSTDAVTLTCTMKKLPSLQELDELSEDLNDMLVSKRLTDVTLQVGEQVIEAHKVILAAHSSVFAAMFEEEMPENNSGVVSITNCDSGSFKNLLKFFYSGRADITEDNVFHLYKIAKYHSVIDLMSCCVAFMIENLSVNNVCDIAVHGDRYSEQELFNLAQDFLETNIQIILCTSKWKSFLRENHAVAYKLLKNIAPKIRIDK